MSTFSKNLQAFFILPDTFDPDDLRLRRVCSFALVALGLSGLVSAAFTFSGIDSLREMMADYPAYFRLFVLSLLTFFLSVGLFALNRWKHTPKYLTGWSLVGGITVLLIICGHSLNDLLSCQSQIAWALPILLAAIVLPPRSAFLAFALVMTIIIILTPAPTINRLNYWMFMILFVIAFLVWLGMSIANKAIRDARNESQKNRAILDGVADGVVVVGVDNKIILANPVAIEMTDGDVFKIVFAGENAEIGGRILSLRWSSVPGVGRVAIIRDISRQVEIDHAKDAVLGVVSHEMRTPLAAILGLTESLGSTSRPNADKLERIYANAQRMMTLVNDLLDQAHIEARALKMHNASFSPISLANAIQDSFCARAKDKQIAFSLVVAESLPGTLIGDLHRYQQILTNLVDNAIKFTKEAGRVEVCITTGDKADEWQMSVSDTGIGIPPERLPDIFLPFRRGSDYTRRNCQGAGLGLSIAKRIAQLAHGDIEVKSTIGHGSTFTVTLPINGGV